MAGDALLRELAHLFLGGFLALHQDDAGHGLFAVLLVGHADDLAVAHLRMGDHEVFDFLGVNVLATADDHVLDAAGHAEVAVLVAHHEVA